MPVTAIIPIVEDYREVILPAGYADQIRHSLIVGDYLYYFCGFPLGQMLKINKNDFSDRTVLTFPNDGKHRVPLEMCHSAGILYCLFRNVDFPPDEPENFQLTIGRVDLDPFAILSDFVDITGTYLPQSGSITTDDTYIYALMWHGTPSPLLRWKISDSTLLAGSVTGQTQGHCVRYAGGKLYATGWTLPANAWLARITTDLAIEQTAEWSTTVTEQALRQFAMSSSHIWFADRSLSGIVKKFTKSDLSIVTDLPTGQLSRYTSSANDGQHIWVLFENGRSVRIDPSTNAQAVYTLNDGQGFQSELLGDGTYIWAGWNQDATKIARYHIPPDVASGSLDWSRFIFGTLSGFLGARAQVIGVTTDSANNVIAVGTFTSGEVNFCGTPTSGTFTDCSTTRTTTGTDIFIAKYNPDRSLMWVQTFQTTNPQFLYVAIDTSDNIFITGAFYNSLNLGGGSLPYTGLGSYSNVFVGWFTPGSQGVPGTHLFSRSIGSNRSSSRPNGIVVDAAGTVILTGSAAINTDFGGGLTTGGGFIAKYSASNVYQWDKVFAATPSSITIDTLDANAIILLGGGSVNLGGGTIPNPNSAWVAKFTAGSLGVPGSHVWSRPVVTSGAAFANGVGIDASNRVIVAGSFGGAVNFGGGNVSTDQGTTAAYVVIFDSASNYVNLIKLGGSNAGGVNGAETAFGVDIDLANNIAIFGRASGNVDWGTGTPDVATSGNNAFVAKYNSSLGYLWHHRYPGVANIQGAGISVDPSSNVIFGGSFIGGFDFGDGNWNSPITSDGMLLKFLP